MQTISTFKFITVSPTPSSFIPRISITCPLFFKKFSSGTQFSSSISNRQKKQRYWKRSMSGFKSHWRKRSHCTLTACHQSREDRAAWFVEKSDWHGQLSLDNTDLYIRYLKSGPGELEKDVERRFSYALSREDIENAILGGP